MTDTERLGYDKRRWVVLVVSCIVNLVIGTGYAWSVFGAAWAAKFTEISGTQVTPGDTALVFTVCNAVGPITMITGGKINDVLGPKWVVFIGGLMFGGGAFLSGFAQSIGFLIMTYGLLFGLGMGLIYSCTIGNTVKFFPDRRGFVGGCTTACYGLGSVILAPIAAKMVVPESFGVQNTFKILGIVYLVIICVGAFLITKCPSDYLPTGFVAPAPKVGQKAPQDKNWKQMLADPAFWVMLVLLLCGAFTGMMMISQCSSIAKFMGIAAAATIVSVLALFNALGRVASGTISDKLGRVNTLIGCLVIAFVGLLCMFKSASFDATGALASANFGLFIFGVCCVGFAFGSFMGVYPGFTADQFGPRNNGVNYGIMFIAFALAGVLGPMIMKNVVATTGTYQKAYLIAIGFVIVGLVFTFIYKAISKTKKA